MNRWYTFFACSQEKFVLFWSAGRNPQRLDVTSYPRLKKIAEPQVPRPAHRDFASVAQDGNAPVLAGGFDTRDALQVHRVRTMHLYEAGWIKRLGQTAQCLRLEPGFDPPPEPAGCNSPSIGGLSGHRVAKSSLRNEFANSRANSLQRELWSVSELHLPGVAIPWATVRLWCVATRARERYVVILQGGSWHAARDAPPPRNVPSREFVL
jgi:hypothetical protein